MILPNDEIGISDLLGHAECPRRMAFGMERHSPRDYVHPETGKTIGFKDRPEAESDASAYGHAIHDAVELVEREALSDEDAVTLVMASWGKFLEPSDEQRLQEDLGVFHARDYKGVRTVVQEENWRVPLIEHEGVTIHFRFKLDKLYQRLDNEAAFIHVDYKSSKWAKSEDEVHEDKQMWAYNWGIHEVFPECDRLVQVYDQFNFGQQYTRKNDEQREQIRRFLQNRAVAVIEDDDLAPTFNEWCPWCALKMDCPVVRDELTDWAEARIKALDPSDRDTTPIESYIDDLDKVSRAKKVLEKFEEEARKVLKALPDDERAEFGYRLRPRANRNWTPDGLRDAHEIAGERFYELVGLTKSRLEKQYGDDEGTLEALLALAEEVDGSPSLVKARSA